MNNTKKELLDQVKELEERIKEYPKAYYFTASFFEQLKDLIRKLKRL